MPTACEYISEADERLLQIGDTAVQDDAKLKMVDWKSKTANVIVLISCAFIMAVALKTIGVDRRIGALNSGAIDALSHAATLQQKARVDFPYEWIQTAQLLSEGSPDQRRLAISLLTRALETQPSEPNAWALLAHLEARDATPLSDASKQAFRRSIEVCPYCEKSLLRWRLEFVLRYWSEIPEQDRLSVFSGADLLRWWHLDGDFLKKARATAILRGIPFDEYRRKIDTPVRPNEIQ